MWWPRVMRSNDTRRIRGIGQVDVTDREIAGPEFPRLIPTTVGRVVAKDRVWEAECPGIRQDARDWLRAGGDVGSRMPGDQDP